MKQNIMLSIFAIIISVLACGCDKTTEPDTTPPQISISSPVHESSVRDTVKITAAVADNDGIEKVDLYVDGELFSTVGSKQFEIIWDTKLETSGEHSLQCKATDNAGNETLSDIIKVTVANYLFKATFTKIHKESYFFPIQLSALHS